jgi:acyl-CoA dehydrogenase
MTPLIWLAVIAGALVVLARCGGSLRAWTAGIAVALVVLGASGFLGFWPAVVLWALFLSAAVPLNAVPLRRRLLAAPARARIRSVLPPMSATEREAIEAGTVGWEGELFAGAPDWNRLLRGGGPRLTEAEQAFLDGPVEALCRMLDDWSIGRAQDLPAEFWDFMGRHRFFGMIIPEAYGGLAFSAYAHSQVVMKLSTRSMTAGVTVMVPNSLGPAELLLHYGTEEQKNHYLPRLADGREIPCFGLTGPFAGSDATAIPDTGVVCWGQHNGERVLGLRVNWEKRYITLGPVATVLGLAFKAFDPDGLLGDERDLGITCALIPTDAAGIDIGRRHDPMGTAFQNGPNKGTDVFVPLDWVIGGPEGVGHGWTMLMECLATGRGISLPAQGTAGGKYCSRYAGAYARIRHQFKQPIGRFEGIQEALARIGAKTYMMDAARLLTLSALDAGEKPPVASAMLKHFNTEANRACINDAMDIHGGRGICDGPSNYLRIPYRGIPVAITVEGANILTRSMIVFGQGAMRCHPYLLDEIQAAQKDTGDSAVAEFDAALFGHMGYSVRNGARALVHGLTGARLAPTPVPGPPARYFRQLARMSAAFAFVADWTLLVLGGELKREEMLSGRFADALSHLYVASGVLKAYEDAGRPHADWPLVEWSLRYCLYHCEEALVGVLRNFPVPGIGPAVRALVFPLGRRQRYPDDALGRQAAALLLEPGEPRDRLTAGMYVDDRPDDITGRIEHALRLALEAEPIERRLRKHRIEQPAGVSFADWTARLVADGTLAQHEAELLVRWQAAHRAAIDVDDFSTEELRGGPAASPGRAAGKKTAAKKTAAKQSTAKKAAAKKATSAKKTASKRTASKKRSASGENADVPGAAPADAGGNGADSGEGPATS